MKPTVNQDAFAWVKARILDEPRSFNMADFFDMTSTRTGLDGVQHEYIPAVVARQGPPCHTVACIAGWAAVYEQPGHLPVLVYSQLGTNLDFDVETTAEEVLGVTSRQASALFYRGNWPSAFQDALRAATPGTLPYARVAVDRLDHFLKTGE